MTMSRFQVDVDKITAGSKIVADDAPTLHDALFPLKPGPSYKVQADEHGELFVLPDKGGPVRFYLHDLMTLDRKRYVGIQRAF